MTPTVTDKRPTGLNIGQAWQTLEDDEARRGYLIGKLGMTVRVRGRGRSPRAHRGVVHGVRPGEPGQRLLARGR